MLQGEKAYSCTLCGTRFTYRNGLIKHTKLNRCPKKVVTPEGETIIKKRTRTTTSKPRRPRAQKKEAQNEEQTSGNPVVDSLSLNSGQIMKVCFSSLIRKLI